MELNHTFSYEYRTVGIVGTASFCVVLPKQYAVSLKIGKGDPVKVHQNGNKIIIEKA
jgi:bifunctional DNA-binding transcriptional regulator/antitoxin component of YhaV-PrlF toxin-antitoxin module